MKWIKPQGKQRACSERNPKSSLDLLFSNYVEKKNKTNPYLIFKTWVLVDYLDIVENVWIAQCGVRQQTGINLMCCEVKRVDRGNAEERGKTLNVRPPTKSFDSETQKERKSKKKRKDFFTSSLSLSFPKIETFSNCISCINVKLFHYFFVIVKSTGFT